MTDKDKNSNSKSDWLKKIKDQENVGEDDQKQTMLDEGENEVEIEVEIKDKVEEKEKVSASESEEEKDSEKEEEIKEETSEDKVQDDKLEDKAQGDKLENRVEPAIEEESKMLPSAELPAAEESISDVREGLPKNIYAHFLLIDINAPVKEIRVLPRYIAINNSRTLIGRYSKAHICLDDPASVEIKHAKLIFEENKGQKAFVIYQINNSTVSVNGSSLSGNGVVLKSGDCVEIGSAKLIFFHRDLRRTA